MTHPIFQKELELLKELIEMQQEIQKDTLISFYLASLQRASLAVVEESVGEETPHHYMCSVNKDEPCNCGQFSRNASRLKTLATARTIVGED